MNGRLVPGGVWPRLVRLGVTTLGVCAISAAPAHAQWADHATTSFPARSAMSLGDVVASRFVSSSPVTAVARGLTPQAPYRVASDSGAVPVRADTKGAEVTVVRVPVPATVRLDAVMTLRSATYRLVVGRNVQVLGPTSGRIDPARDTTIVVAFRVSRRAPAGRSLAATAEFSVGTVSASVPIELTVPARRQLTLSLETTSLLATRGRWTSVPLRVSNAGNVDEYAAVGVGVPQGWRADVRVASRTQRVAPGQSLPVSLRLWIPSQANSGLVMLPVRLVRPGERDTTEQLQVDVMGDFSREQNGTRVTTSVISGQAAGQPAATAYALGLSGNLSDSTTISGRLSYAGALDASGSRGLLLARSGMLTGPPTLDIRHPALHIQAGSALVPQAELGGHNIAGLGGAVALQRAGVVLRAFDLRPMGATMTASLLPIGAGRLQGGEIGFVTSQVRASAFGSRLDDAFTQRTLEAYGVRAGFGSAGGLQLLSEVAYRDAGSQRGLGVSTTFQHTGARSFVEARALHAPGGSAGFARATDDLSLSASRSLGGRGFVAINGWRQRDANPVLGALQNSGWSVAPSVDLPRLGTVGVDLRGGNFLSTVATTRLGNTEVSGGGMWSTTLRGTAVIARSSLSRIDRAITESDWSSTSRQWRLDHSVSLLRGSAHGTVQGNWTYQQFSAMAGTLPAQQSLHVRAERVRPRLSSPVSFEGEIQRLQVGASGPAFWSARAAATLDLRFGLSVTLAAERNPFMNMMAGARRAPLAYTLRIDRTSLVPRLLSGARNQVFRDDNGNGRRDRHERGVGGVVIRCGGRLVQTDTDGRFSCAEREQMLDARTVPVGLLAPSMAIAFGTPVALRIVRPVRVALTLSGNDTLRLRAAILTDAVVFARDSAGGLWYARADTSGQFVLEALPQGRYHIGVDATSLEEPLSMTDAEPVVQIGGADAPELVTIGMRARPIRVKTFDATSPGTRVRPAAPVAPTRRLRKAPRAQLERTSDASRSRVR